MKISVHDIIKVHFFFKTMFTVTRICISLVRRNTDFFCNALLVQGLSFSQRMCRTFTCLK